MLIKRNYSLFSILFIIFCTLAVSGCAKRVTRIKRDGPPKHIPNLDKIPNAVPKVEPLGRGNRFKNSNVYTEKNKRYKVLSTSKGYKKQGCASWYGTLFHGRRTSSGEPYNMFAMTAAHPTLPIPTYVKVTNLDNHKSVVVKVNDRGPFRCNRLIDVSYVAAAKLGILGKGTGNVEVQSVDPRDHGHHAAKRLLADKTPPKINSPLKTAVHSPMIAAAKGPKTKITDPQKMYLQLGSFENKKGALDLLQKIERITKAPTSITENKQGIGPRFLVQIGPLKNHMEAIKLTQKLAQEKISCPGIIAQR